MRVELSTDDVIRSFVMVKRCLVNPHYSLTVVPHDKRWKKFDKLRVKLIKNKIDPISYFTYHLTSNKYFVNLSTLTSSKAVQRYITENGSYNVEVYLNEKKRQEDLRK